MSTVYDDHGCDAVILEPNQFVFHIKVLQATLKCAKGGVTVVDMNPDCCNPERKYSS